MDEISQYSSPITACLAGMLSDTSRAIGGTAKRFNAALLHGDVEVIPEDMWSVLRELRQEVEKLRPTAGHRVIQQICNDYLGPDRRRAPTYALLVRLFGPPESTPWADVRPSDSRANALVQALRVLLGFEDALIRDVSERVEALHDIAHRISPECRKIYDDFTGRLTHGSTHDLQIADLLAWRKCLANEALALAAELTEQRKEA